MDLTFERFDARGHVFKDIIDRDTGKKVGSIRTGGVGFGNSGGIDVSMFGGKYRGYLNHYDECVGFVKGVQAVLRHMNSTDYPQQSESAA